MRKVLYILAFTTFAFAVSCDSNVDINANANPASTEEKTSDTISNSIDSQNSNINGLESEIELLKKELENAKLFLVKPCVLLKKFRLLISCF